MGTQFIQHHLGIFVIGLVPATVRCTRQMGRRQYMTFDANFPQPIVQAKSTTTGFVGEHNLLGTTFRSERFDEFNPSIHIVRWPLFRNDSPLITAQLQSYSHIVQIASNHDKLAHGQSSLNCWGKNSHFLSRRVYLPLYLYFST